jgi:hypothetical protein
MRRRARIVPVVLALVTVACGEKFEHVNPYDPAVPVTIVVSGPDTLFSFNEVAHYSAQSVPVFPDTAFQFASTDTTAFFPVTGGFSSMTPPLYPATLTVQVSALLGQIDTINNTQNLSCPTAPPCHSTVDCPPPPACHAAAEHSLAWRHSASKSVVLTQRVVRIALRCPADHACDTLAAGSVWTVWVNGFDALNQQIVSLTGANANPMPATELGPIATFALRDSTIGALTPVGVRVANVTALKTGSTWIVATRGPFTDSLRLVVR